MKANIGIFVRSGMLVAAGVMFAACNSHNATKASGSKAETPSSAAIAEAAAPAYIADRSACPYEGCEYGERWRATRDSDLFVKPPQEPRTPVSTLQRASVAREGTWVTTETGVVLARRRSARTNRFSNLTGVDGLPGPHPAAGQSLFVYSPVGEGCYRSWLAGNFFIACNIDLDSPSDEFEWWVQVKKNDGSRGWTNAKWKAFESQKDLDTQLARVIGDDQPTRAEKLIRVDVLLRKGADLNGSGGKYGYAPIHAAVDSNDVELLQALMKKGLDPNGRPCLASYVSQRALRPGALPMLEFLLDNGMTTRCLPEPPLIAFLQFGIATRQYPTQQAIRVAELLVNRGVADVEQNDAQGKSVIDRIDELPPEPLKRVAPLREALQELKTKRI